MTSALLGAERINACVMSDGAVFSNREWVASGSSAREVGEIPPPPASRARDASTSSPTRTRFLQEHLPGNAAAEDEENAGEARAIGDLRPSGL